MNQTRSKSLTGLFILIFSLFFVFLLFAFYTIRSLKSGSDEFESYLEDNKNSAIAVVEITGPIMESKTIIKDLLSTEKDKSIKAILVRIDSPGGAVGPTQEIYEEIRRIDTVKPVYASFGTIAASGGYYIGAACRKIYANAGTLTGSIGVIMQFMDLSKLYEFAKISPTTIKAGHYKDVGDPSRALTPEERELLTGMIAGTHEQFRRDILAVRKDKIKGDFNTHTQGQIFSGEDAKKIGLVDEIGGLWATGRAIHKELNLKGKFGLRFIKHKKNLSFSEFLENVDESFSHIRNNVIASKMPTFMYAP
ncbi:MAG: signal peptide peptidase SppA [Bacteriovoracaceae bacterium]